MDSRTARRPWLPVLMLVLATLACNFPGFNSQTPGAQTETPPTNTPLPVASQTPTPEPDATTIVIPTVTPQEEDEEEACTFRAAFVEDVTIPDDTDIAADEVFDKTWRIRNSGTCAWEAGTSLVFVSGDDLSEAEAISVPETAPDGELELTVTMQAPTAPGTYRSNWQLQRPNGRRFGGVFYARIVVAGEGEEPEAEPTAVIATAPKEFLGAVAADCSQVTFNWIDGQGESSYRLGGPSLSVVLDADATTHVWNAPPTGWMTITLTALDSGDEAIASLETVVSVACGVGTPDLSVISVTTVPTVPVAYLPVTTSVRIENAGDADSSGFLVQWRAIKTSPSATCSWVVAEGLGAGETRDLSCTTTAYNAPYANLVTYAVADSSEIVAESDEDNNALDAARSVVAAEVVYDFVTNAADAAWIGAPPTTNLPWPGDPASDLGYARLTGGTVETGGTIQGLCLETHPRRVADGIVRGEFEGFTDPEYQIQPGDHIRAAVGMLEGAEEGAVTYRVLAVLSEAGAQWVVSEPHAYGEGIEVLSADLTPYAGQTAAVVLQVEAGPDADDDQACWMSVQLLRYP